MKFCTSLQAADGSRILVLGRRRRVLLFIATDGVSHRFELDDSAVEALIETLRGKTGEG